MSSKRSKARRPAGTVRAAPEPKESWIEQTASFIGFFIYLLILKTFFLPLFIIPTGSMAETLYGANAAETCPNCGIEYTVGFLRSPPRPAHDPLLLECPNCRWRLLHGARPNQRQDRHRHRRAGALADGTVQRHLTARQGDRIFVHGWLFDRPLAGIEGLGPARWDVVVFKVPTDGHTNYIKRLIGLPDEKIELIDGDVFVNDQIARKTADAQRSLWFAYYNHDYPPHGPSPHAGYYPRWVAQGEDSSWSGLGTRVIRFNGPPNTRSEIQFVTDPHSSTRPGLVHDVYGYNEPHPEMRPNIVTDVRLSGQVELTPGADDGYVEFSTTKGDHHFYVRLCADGGMTMQHKRDQDADRETWGQWQAPHPAGPVHLALSHADGTVRVEVDGRTLFESTRVQYEITPRIARALAAVKAPPTLRIAAENVQATLRHLLIKRDAYYTSDVRGAERAVYAVQGNPIQLGPDEYFVLGDNSPNSQDARYAFARRGQDAVGPHLKEAYAQGAYQLGTVPADQMIGRAFFVYWPGFMPLTPWGPHWLPDLGRARWIR